MVCQKKPRHNLGATGNIKKNIYIFTDVLLYFNIITQLLIYQYASAVFTYHYFFMLFDLTLLLRRNRIKTTAAGISFYGYHSQTIAVTFTDLVITGQ